MARSTGLRGRARLAGLLLILAASSAPAGEPDDGPTLVKPAEAGARLRTPGGDRYGPDAVDWSTVPPWQQTTFFDVRVQGRVFIYVVDCSGSMIDGARLARAKAEVRRSVIRLQHPQRFKVIFYHTRPVPMPGDGLRSADLASKDKLLRWLDIIEPNGETDPRGAMSLAIGMKPDAIFLLSDGEFPEGTPEAIAERNRSKIPIHCVDLAGGAAGDDLARIARDSGGRYASRP